MPQTHTVNTPLPASLVSAPVFVVLASAWLGLSWYAATQFLSGPLWLALLALLVIALPLAVIGAYEASIAKTLRREKYRREGTIFRLFSGRTLLLLLTFVVALLAGVLLLLRLYLLPALDWLWLLGIIPLYLLLFRLLHRLLRHEYKPWLLMSAVLVWARVLCPTLLMAVYVPVLWLQQTPEPALALGASIADAQASVSNISASMTLATLASFMAILEGMKAFLLGSPDAAELHALLLVVALEAWMTFYLVCTVLSVFLLPRSEWRRIFGPLTDAAVVPVVSGARLAASSAIVTFVLLFVFVPAMSYLEIWILEHPQVSNSPERFVIHVEQIGNDYYAPGTLDALQQARQQVLSQLDLVAERLRQETDVAFLAMESNVDSYLDWYYSLGGEYGRIGNLLVGNLENYMAQKLTDTLERGDVFAGVQALLDDSVRSSAEAQRLYASLATDILDTRRVDARGQEVNVQQSLALDNFSLQLPEHEALASFQNRLLVSSGGAAAAGVVSSVVAGKLTSKVLAKSSFKLAAKSLGKLIAGKTAGATFGAGAGAATGAAVGSVVPGIGTAIGAVIGGMAGGIAAGIGIDKALIELEEAVSREAFRAELIAAIDEARDDFLAPASSQ